MDGKPSGTVCLAGREGKSPEKDIEADQGETEIQKEQLDSGSLCRSGNRRIYDLDTDLLSIFRK